MNHKIIFGKLQFIDSAISIASSSSNVVENLAEGINEIKCKHVHYNKNCKTCWIKYTKYECSLEYTNFESNLIPTQMFMLQKVLPKKNWWKLKQEIC